MANTDGSDGSMTAEAAKRSSYISTMLGLEEIGTAGNGKPPNSGGNAPEECKMASPRKYLLSQPKNAHLALECPASEQSAITKSAGCEWEILSLFFSVRAVLVAGAYLPRQTLGSAERSDEWQQKRREPRTARKLARLGFGEEQPGKINQGTGSRTYLDS